MTQQRKNNGITKLIVHILHFSLYIIYSEWPSVTVTVILVLLTKEMGLIENNYFP